MFDAHPLCNLLVPFRLGLSRELKGGRRAQRRGHAVRHQRLLLRVILWMKFAHVACNRISDRMRNVDAGVGKTHSCIDGGQHHLGACVTVLSVFHDLGRNSPTSLIAFSHQISLIGLAP